VSDFEKFSNRQCWANFALFAHVHMQQTYSIFYPVRLFPPFRLFGTGDYVLFLRPCNQESLWAFFKNDWHTKRPWQMLLDHIVSPSTHQTLKSQLYIFLYYTGMDFTIGITQRTKGILALQFIWTTSSRRPKNGLIGSLIIKIQYKPSCATNGNRIKVIKELMRDVLI